MKLEDVGPGAPFDAFNLGARALSVPTPSRLERIMLCRGSWRLEESLPEGPEGEESKRGTRCHKAMETGDRSALSVEEVGAVLEAERLVDVFLEHLGWHYLKDKVEHEKIQRALFGSHSIPTMHDVHLETETSVVIADYKFGRKIVPKPDKNWQMIAKAVIASDNSDQRAVWTAVIQPEANYPLNFALLTPPRLRAWRDEIGEAVAEAMGENAPLTPSQEACENCRAKAICPALAKALVPIAAAQEGTLAMLPSDDLGRLRHAWLVAKEFGEAIDAEVRARLEAGLEVPGWTLGRGRRLTTITDPRGVWRAAAAEGLSSDEFLRCVDIGLTKLKAVLAERGLSGKELERAMSRMLADNSVEELSRQPLQEA